MKSFLRWAGFTALFFAVCLAASLPALAATADVSMSWERPTAYEDGSPLPASSISGYSVLCGFTSTGASSPAPCTFTPTSIAGNALTGSVTLTYPPEGGDACFRLVTRVGALESVPSEASCVHFEPLRPGSPSNFKVTITVRIEFTNQ